MSTSINQEYLFEYDIPPIGQQPGPMAGQPPAGMAGMPGDPMAQGSNIQNGEPQEVPPEDMADTPPTDIADDPQQPDMPEDHGDSDDFEVWKMNFYKEAIKGDQNALVDMILKVRDNELDPIQRKFIEDNFNILLLRRNANINQISNEIRKMIKSDLDRTNPAATLVNHITNALDKSPMTNEIFIKFNGLSGAKGDLHRKFLGSLIGAVQVGSGGNTEDFNVQEP